MMTYNNEPVLLVEESSRFKTPTVVQVFACLADARESVQEIILTLSARMQAFEVGRSGDVTWYGRNLLYKGGDEFERTVRARFYLVRLSQAIKGFGVQTDEDGDPLVTIRNAN
jgi:hypothetical protein